VRQQGLSAVRQYRSSAVKTSGMHRFTCPRKEMHAEVGVKAQTKADNEPDKEKQTKLGDNSFEHIAKLDKASISEDYQLAMFVGPQWVRSGGIERPEASEYHEKPPEAHHKLLQQCLTKCWPGWKRQEVLRAKIGVMTYYGPRMYTLKLSNRSPHVESAASDRACGGRPELCSLESASQS
jgi:hypothetical protein